MFDFAAPIPRDRFVCSCGVVVVMSDDYATRSRDVREQAEVGRCTACWRLQQKGKSS
jgi:hypothetical protein